MKTHHASLVSAAAYGHLLKPNHAQKQSTKRCQPIDVIQKSSLVIQKKQGPSHPLMNQINTLI